MSSAGPNHVIDSGEHDLAVLLSRLSPQQHNGIYRFATLPVDTPFDRQRAVCVLQEAQQLSIIAAEQDMPAAAQVSGPRCGWITLQVHSSLAAIGLTAAVAQALTRARISCNVVAGTRHDHLFVPLDQAAYAMTVLQTLQQHAAAGFDDDGNTPS